MNLSPFKFKKEKGATLTAVIFMVALVLSMITVYMKQADFNRHAKNNEDLRSKRDEVGKTLLTYLSNQEVIKKSADPLQISYSEANKLLSTCLMGGEKNTKNCKSFNLKSKADQKGYYPYPQLVVTPTESFAFPPDKTGSKNCPYKGHISCLLAGKTNSSQSVGYNFQGETGPLSSCFPLEPVVYLNPECPKDDVGREQTSCERAENIRLAYQIIHREFSETCSTVAKNTSKKQDALYLGVFPKELSFISMPRHALVAYECNVGAFALGHEADGNITCACQFPYVPIEGQRNEKGVLCQQIEDKCPGGTLFVGRSANGQPICKKLEEMTKSFPQSMSIATENYPGQLPSSRISCNEYGWLQNVDVSCDANLSPTPEENQKGHSCLMFYGIIKMLDGKDMLPGAVPCDFYPGGKKLCHAKSEKSTYRFPQNWYDFSCLGAITGLLLLGSGGTGSIKKMFFEKAASKIVSDSASKVMAKSTLKEVAKNALKSAGKKLSADAQKDILKAASKKIQDAASAAAEAAAKKAGATVGSVRKAALDAAKEAGAKSVAEGIEKSVKKLDTDTLKAVAEKASEGVAKGADEVVGASSVFTKIDKKLFGNTLANSAENAGNLIKTKGGAITEADLAKQLGRKEGMYQAKEKLKQIRLRDGAMAAGAYASPFLNILIGDLTPELFAQSIALDTGIDVAGIAAKQLLSVPIFGPALYAAAIALAAFNFASWSVEVRYDCYPINGNPVFSCQINGTCYDYDGSIQ